MHAHACAHTHAHTHVHAQLRMRDSRRPFLEQLQRGESAALTIQRWWRARLKRKQAQGQPDVLQCLKKVCECVRARARVQHITSNIMPRACVCALVCVCVCVCVMEEGEAGQLCTHVRRHVLYVVDACVSSVPACMCACQRACARTQSLLHSLCAPATPSRCHTSLAPPPLSNGARSTTGGPLSQDSQPGANNTGSPHGKPPAPARLHLEAPRGEGGGEWTHRSGYHPCPRITTVGFSAAWGLGKLSMRAGREALRPCCHPHQCHPPIPPPPLGRWLDCHHSWRLRYHRLTAWARGRLVAVTAARGGP